jgi:hypothetical protein
MSRSDWERELEPELAAFGRRVTAAAADTDSYVEFHESRRYFVSGNLVFTPVGLREREVAVVGVQADEEIGWVFDLINETSTVLAEATAPATSDEATVRLVFGDFLRTAEPLLLSIVRGR